MNEQSVQKGFSKKSAWEALFSCGQNQKTVQKVSREQCMCPNCYYRTGGKERACLLTVTIENHEGLCMNYQGDDGCFPERMHYPAVDEGDIQKRIFIWRHRGLGDIACVLMNGSQAYFSSEDLAALLGVKFTGFLKRYFKLLKPVRIQVPDDSSVEGCRGVFFLDYLGLERALLLETIIDPWLRRLICEELVLVGANIKRLMAGKKALLAGVDVKSAE